MQSWFQDPEDAMDIGSLDLSDKNSKLNFEKLNQENFEGLMQRHPYLKDRIKGVFDEIIRANII